MQTITTKQAIVTLVAVLASALSVPDSALADEARFEKAALAAQESRLQDMQRIYEEILQDQPDNVRALLGLAAAQAWQKDYSNAQSTYARAILIEPDNVDARVGQGYAYAWAGDYSRAHNSFQQALRIDPVNLGARKGIAYTYHWSGEGELALEFFEIAQSIAPADAEIVEATGQVKLSLGHARDAVSDFNAALRLDPQRESARLARRNAYQAAPALEASARFGSTSGADSGLRSLELAHWPQSDTRLAVRYDNSLGLDNSSIASRGEDAPGYFLAAHHRFSDRWAAGGEVGRRDVVDGDLDIVMLQGIYSRGSGSLRLGGQLGRHDDGYTDQLLFAGYGFPVGHKWRVEPIVYLSQSGAAEDDEWRAVVNAEFLSHSTWSAGAFAGTGQISAFDPAFDGSTSLVGAWANLLVADRHSIHLAIRREESPSNDITVAEVGFTFRLPGN